jgi:hypothetical protein
MIANTLTFPIFRMSSSITFFRTGGLECEMWFDLKRPDRIRHSQSSEITGLGFPWTGSIRMTADYFILTDGQLAWNEPTWKKVTVWSVRAWNSDNHLNIKALFLGSPTAMNRPSEVEGSIAKAMIFAIRVHLWSDKDQYWMIRQRSIPGRLHPKRWIFIANCGEILVKVNNQWTIQFRVNHCFSLNLCLHWEIMNKLRFSLGPVSRIVKQSIGPVIIGCTVIRQTGGWIRNCPPAKNPEDSVAALFHTAATFQTETAMIWIELQFLVRRRSQNHWRPLYYCNQLNPFTTFARPPTLRNPSRNWLTWFLFSLLH